MKRPCFVFPFIIHELSGSGRELLPHWQRDWIAELQLCWKHLVPWCCSRSFSDAEFRGAIGRQAIRVSEEGGVHFRLIGVCNNWSCDEVKQKCGGFAKVFSSAEPLGLCNDDRLSSVRKYVFGTTCYLPLSFNVLIFSKVCTTGFFNPVFLSEEFDIWIYKVSINTIQYLDICIVFFCDVDHALPPVSEVGKGYPAR